ncbi:hypothetical protein KSP40_PGU020623 [Platanthera guangdongensis]|uniref:Uncharacterized protein n=1 Tax=Platanthera guangdongensis TaxID=2320717 RepID=A0ABR2MEL5_9ASPA
MATSRGRRKGDLVVEALNRVGGGIVRSHRAKRTAGPVYVRSYQKVLEMESLFLMPDISRSDLACLLRNVQAEEKKKLHMVSIYLLLDDFKQSAISVSPSLFFDLPALDRSVKNVKLKPINYAFWFLQ